MGQFRVWIETTRKGSFQVRYQKPAGPRLSTGYCIEPNESATFDGKLLTGKTLAKALAKRFYDKHMGDGAGDPKALLEPLLEQYLQEMAANNYSRNTINHNRNSIEPYLKDNALTIVMDSTNDVIKEWKLKMFQDDMGANTIRGRLGDVRTFHNWLKANGKINTNPFGLKMMPLRKGKEPQYYTAAEFKALDAAMATISHEARIGINLAHDCGLRKTEFVGDGHGRGGVLWSDITWYPKEDPDLLIRKEVAKGGAQSGTVTLTPGILTLLGSRRQGPLVPITRSQFDHYFSRAREVAAINPKLHVHGLRDSFAKNFLQRTGENLAALKVAMRHKSIISTMVYVQFERTHIKDAFRRSYEGRVQEEALLAAQGVL